MATVDHAAGRRSRSVRTRLAGLLALAAFFGGAAAVIWAGQRGGTAPAPAPVAAPVVPATKSAARQTKPAAVRPKPRARPKPKPPGAAAVRARGIAAYDPQGDGHENDQIAGLATDGDPATFWRTETYLNPFHKAGVGLVLDLGRPLRATSLRLLTDAPGFTAEIVAGPTPSGPFTRVADAITTIAPTTSYTLDEPAAARYLVVWITALAGATGEVHVNEVTVRGR